MRRPNPYILLISFCLLHITSFAQTPSYAWARAAGGTDYDFGRSITNDASGNVLVTGSFQSSNITFGTSTLINAGAHDLFIVKYDAAANVLWAKSAGGASYDVVQSILTDASGNVLVAGYFQSPTITFGTITLTNAGGSDAFIVKYNAAGNVLWAKAAGGSLDDHSDDISADASGNVLVTGSFKSSSIAFGTTTLTNVGSQDIFTVKFDASGNVLWAKAAGGSAYGYSNDISTDASGNVLVSGTFQSPTITFGTYTLANAGGNDLFIVKYDAGGNMLWAKAAGGIFNNYNSCIGTDASGNIFVTGSYKSPSTNFGSTTLTNASAGSYDIFIVKYNASGNVLWAKAVAGTSDDFGQSICTDAIGNLFVTGTFRSSTLTFGTTTLSNSGTNGDIFVVKYDAGGNVLWAKADGGTAEDGNDCISIDANGNLLITGFFQSPTITFGTTTFTNAGNHDIFIAKMNTLGASLIEDHNVAKFALYPNPAHDKLHIEIENNLPVNILISNTRGEIVLKKTLEIPKNIDISELPAGVYFLKAGLEKDQKIFKIIKE